MIEPATRRVLVPPERVERWFANFVGRHGPIELAVVDERLVASAADGASATAALPWGSQYAGPPEIVAFAAAAGTPVGWALLLVRKGGFAVARLHGEELLASKVGRRHVQGRTKAGGQSQQRFARRRANQARQAYEAAADHAHRVLVLEATEGRVERLVCGGDRSAVDEVLADRRLHQLAALRTPPWLDVPDPRRDTLERAARDGRSVPIEVRDPTQGSH